MDVNPKRQPSLPDLDAAALSAAPQPAEGTPLSDFIRNATPERKAEVYGAVMDKVAEHQRGVIASAAPQPVVVEPLTAKEDAALLWLGSVRDNFRRMADEANNLLTQACSRLAASSPQEKERG